MLNIKTFLSLLACLLVAVPSGAASPGDATLDPQARFEALLERMRTEQAGLSSLTADFTQWRESAMLIEPETSQGLFRFVAPDQVRWEFIAPDPISLVISGDSMITWYRDLDRAERMAIGGQSQKVLRYLGASSSIDELLEYFSVEVVFPEETGDHYRLDLDPRYKRLARRLQSMSVWVDTDLYLPVRLRYVDGSGDVTEYRFANLVPNAEVAADQFELTLPDQVEIRTVELGRDGR